MELAFFFLSLNPSKVSNPVKIKTIPKACKKIADDKYHLL
jgi:hypothetical protein